MTIHPVILSGGAGSRLWPLSRSAYPKQLMPLLSEESLLQETARRIVDPARFAAPLLVCNDEHRFIVAEQLRQIGVAPARILLEPIARNTAPAAAAAALTVAATSPDALLLLLPSDHHIGGRDRFLAAVDCAVAAAEGGALVTFGMTPARPETGYGYILRGAPLAGAGGCFRVARFVEKPDRRTAEAYLADGRYLWNSGMFLFRADRLVAEMETHAPAVLDSVRRALDGAAQDLDFLRLDRDALADAPSISIDYAVMERTEAAAVVPAEMAWSDVGSWDALWECVARDGEGNVLSGDVIVADTRDSYVRADGRLVAVLGMEGAIVIDTADAVLVAARDHAQDVKTIVDRLAAAKRPEREHHRRVYRPWGSYESVDAGERFQVKRLIVTPGGRLSLQKHAQRAEHWVVVRGTATVTRGEDVFELRENQSTYIPVGTVHRLENRTSEPVHLIEVQSGGYLGEDDIVRLDDQYGRA
jgi:mannose-1-phosphate guanylyltransferase/mannose-1-phosphate guanylyltransferase/mannose-6-phosphate isomerase